MSTEVKLPEMGDIDLLAETAQLASTIILENGGETSRAEETALILCRTAGWEETEVFALSTGIILTVKHKDGRHQTSVIRIKNRSVNLFRVERVNALSRDYAAGKLTLGELNEKLHALKGSILYSRLTVALAVGISSAMFTLLFEERLNAVVLFDLFITFIGSFFAQYVCSSHRLRGTYQFTVTFLFSVIIGILSALAVSLLGIGNLDVILIGAITPLLPGLSFTNAIRDTVMGDLVSGTVRIVETLLIAVAIAAGIGTVLAVYVNVLGGVL
ncbi:MAG: threonine/serine exporter family protein [Clostridia bacterium]|nr:threonine/serine exporter family protein [Clostridia bacterium]